MPGAYEGETVTRRMLFSGGALAAGGIASAAFGLPALGFALGPIFTKSNPENYQDVGPEADFNPQTYVPKIITLVADIGEVGKTTIYVRRSDPTRDTDKLGFPYIVISTRGPPPASPFLSARAAALFFCPPRGGVSSSDGRAAGGPPVRPLDRFETKVERGRVLVGPRFSLNSQLDKFHTRDPSNHLDGLWHYLYPRRPTTP